MGYLYAILCWVLFGTSYPIAGAAMEKIPVYFFTEVTLIVGTIVSIPLARIKEPEIKWTKLGSKNYIKIFLQALIGALLYTIFLLYGLTYCDPVLASVVTSLTPATTLIAAFFVLKEKVTGRKVIAIALAVGAVVAMTANFGAGTIKFTLAGVIFMLLSVGCVTAFFILAKQISYDMPPFTMTTALLLPSAIMVFPFAVYDLMHFNMSALTSSEWGVMVYYGIFVWYLPYLFTYLAFKYVSASFFGTTTAITPVAAAVASVVLYGAQLRVVDYIGIALVIISVIVIENREQTDNVPEQ